MSRIGDLVSLCFIGSFVMLLPAVLAGATTGPMLPQNQHAPGWLNPEVRQWTVTSTICVKGWTAMIRPPTSYMSFVKKEELRYYKLPGTVGDYELDHLVSLELGGSAYDTRNLWMQPWAQARRDDGLENSWRRKVCAGTLTLKAAHVAELAYKRRNG